MTTAVLARLERLYDDVSPLLTATERSEADRARRSLAEPLRLAVVGRVKSGKSTLVNALVGRRIAPTSAGECTKVVTWYRFGAPDRIELHLTDGTVRPLPFEEQGIPDDLGVRSDAVERLVVHLSSGPLRRLTLIDTPGLDTLTAANDAATRRAILGQTESSQRAAGEADALLYLIGDAARRSDVDFLAEFHASAGNLSASAFNAVGILAQADRFGSGPFDPRDPFELAKDIAAGMAHAHRTELSSVLPVSGLMGETARTGRISEAVAQRLAALAGEDAVALSLRRQDPALIDLFQLFGPYGVTAGRDRAIAAAQLKAWCEAASGVDALETVIRTRLVPRADLLKATRAIGVLTALAAALGSDRRDDVLALVEDARLDPALHPLEELRALQAVSTTAPDSPLAVQLTRFVDEPDSPDLLQLDAGSDADDLAAVARHRSAEATRTAALAIDPVQADAARVLARSYQLLARRISQRTSAHARGR